MLSTLRMLLSSPKRSNSRRRFNYPSACEILEVRCVLTDPLPGSVVPPPLDPSVPPPTAPATPTAPVVLTPQQTQQIASTIQTAVTQSALATLYATYEFYIPDVEPTNGIPFIPFDSTPAVAGFDCDDYALAMANFLNNVLPVNYSVSYVNITYGTPVVGHVMVLVNVDGVTVVVDPQTGLVSAPATTMTVLTPVIEILTAGYAYNGTSTVTVVESTTAPGGSCPFFMTDPLVLDLFTTYMSTVTLNDPELYLGPAPLP